MRPNDLHVSPAMINYSHEQTVLPVYVIIVVTRIGASYNTKYMRQNSKLKTSNFIHYFLAKHLTNVLNNPAARGNNSPTPVAKKLKRSS